jgi:hypothetical protein
MIFPYGTSNKAESRELRKSKDGVMEHALYRRSLDRRSRGTECRIKFRVRMTPARRIKR